eukprot:TRINITY_DN47509_c0_g1_i2.p1 TRINITY_DN47509_c0_g1~~TRINITY_DN47509_c0_g1_i2.p1  ORF type:complete len:301 (-),score=43.90 TRINITY_DN47509_c0_g1_i2:62-895(-)
MWRRTRRRSSLLLLCVAGAVGLTSSYVFFPAFVQLLSSPDGDSASSVTSLPGNPPEGVGRRCGLAAAVAPLIASEVRQDSAGAAVPFRMGTPVPAADLYLQAVSPQLAGLPELSVRFNKTQIHGDMSRFIVADEVIKTAPRVRFDPALGKCTLVMLDPDAPVPEPDGATPGGLGPIVHWIVRSNNNGTFTKNAKDKDTVLSYAGPQPPEGFHRYIFVLFQEVGTPDVQAPGGLVGLNRLNWNFKDFLEKNRNTLKPVASNYFICSPSDDVPANAALK